MMTSVYFPIAFDNMSLRISKLTESQVDFADVQPRYKLRFPVTGGANEYLMFAEDGSLLIETEDFSIGPPERLIRITPEDTIDFLESVGEAGRLPRFVDGRPDGATKALLRRLIKQFGCTADLHRCWSLIGLSYESSQLLNKSER